MRKFLLIFFTLNYLRPVQVQYQFWYRFRRMWRSLTGYKYNLSFNKEGKTLVLTPWINKPISLSNNTFTFLNLSKKYPEKKINWIDNSYGKLWTYNLNYMDYLLQPEIEQETSRKLIEDFIHNLDQKSIGLDPYPIALRGINWIKFFSQNPSISSSFNNSLYAQYIILLDNLEYHLLGNHLLEDGFSLLFGAFYFQDDKLYRSATKIMKQELNEQILADGAHFELSPMYHQIILDRLLDCINLLQNNQSFEDQETLLQLMQEKAQQMLVWLNYITFTNGNIPLLNDSAPGIAPTTTQLNAYAQRLGVRVIRPNSCNLSPSGYRKFSSPIYECVIDTGNIIPSYQPGHAHADTFNFVLNVHNEPLIVDTGISTYEANETRLKERGTAAHNTVTIQDKNSSEIWSSFRVAQRAEVTIEKETDDFIKASHNGYRRLNTIHSREWKFLNDVIIIKDSLAGKITEGKAHLILAPGINPVLNNEKLDLGKAVISFKNALSVKFVPTKLPAGYNIFTENVTVEITFNEYVEYTIALS